MTVRRVETNRASHCRYGDGTPLLVAKSSRHDLADINSSSHLWLSSLLLSTFGLKCILGKLSQYALSTNNSAISSNDEGPTRSLPWTDPDRNTSGMYFQPLFSPLLILFAGSNCCRSESSG